MLHEFNFLKVFEQFELNQYQIALDENMKDLFQVKQMSDAAERKKLIYFDRTNMEQHICRSLLFPTSRNIMRNTVRLVCGVSPNEVSVLFFLYQCYRTGSVTNNLDGINTKLREKLLGYFKKHLSSKLCQSISNITLPIKPIKEINSCPGEKVILKTLQGDKRYTCNILAMALKPDELCDIKFEPALLTENQKSIFTSMTKGRAKKFWIQYEEKFWQKAGFSGDIFSLRGPILWATEQPKLPFTANKDLNPILVGYLKYNEDNTENSEEAVKQQLIDLFGDDAARPVRYIESAIDDVCVPLCGNFLALRRLQHTSHKLEWGALDIFAEGDVAAALEAGHNAYMHLVAYLRPQAQTYEDLVESRWPTFFNDTDPFRRWFSAVNFASSTRVALYATAAYIGYRVLRHLNS
ncbi:probable flavin-containing monoamine oxidase A [Aricia agestis]|uniref:probable flavin-containing monoamine oxidase A n=1 Tax=Aricia agestis TaxID=91739 RepID=UPI001C203BAF|nr:probable flavin-containing monoamine oxidase A [Aricia agestis]